MCEWERDRAVTPDPLNLRLSSDRLAARGSREQSSDLMAGRAPVLNIHERGFVSITTKTPVINLCPSLRTLVEAGARRTGSDHIDFLSEERRKNPQ